MLTRRACLTAAFAPLAQANPHEPPMRRAIQLAAKVPDFPFAAVIVNNSNGKIIAEGWNKSPLNPTFHGEIDVINTCARKHPGVDWSRLTLYTTAEPCPMCQGAVAWAGISTVVYGTSIPFLKTLDWWQIDIRAEEIVRRTPFRECKLIGGVLEKECNDLFLAARKRKQP